MLRDEPQLLCLNCHDSIRHTVESAATQHAAVTSDRQCLNCHDAHASDHARMLLTDMKTLCFECHDREIPLAGGGTLADIKRVIQAGTSLHGPVSQDNCAACHMIHGGDNFRMLIGYILNFADIVSQVHQEPPIGLGQRHPVTCIFRVSNQFPRSLADGPLWLAREPASRLPMELLMG